MIKGLVGIGIMFALAAPAMAQYGGHYVGGYTNSGGTYVQPHYQSNPNSTQYDNYGSRGNVNPYTGEIGTRTPHY